MKLISMFLLFLGSLSTSSAVVVALDFGGANFLDHFTDPGMNTVPNQIRWNNIARDPSLSGPAARIDLVATPAAGSTYDFGGGPSNLQGNGMNGVALGATRLKLAVGTDVTFDFNFFNGNGVPVEVTTSFSFLDFDETTRVADGVTVTEDLHFLGIESTTAGSYTHTSADLFEIDSSNPGQPIFMSDVQGNQGDNPTDLSALTMQQEQKIVQFNVVDSTGFSLNLSVGGTPPAADPDSARTFFIADAISFNEPTTTVPVPEPASTVLCALAGIMAVARRRS